MFKKGSKGFTLIELLVVIAIIGILASVVLASLNRARKQGRDARRVSDIKQIQLALELYFDQVGTYPSNAGTWMADLIGRGVISTVPQDPLTGDYLYFACGSTPFTEYHLGANLEVDPIPANLEAVPAACPGSAIDSPSGDGCSNETDRYCYDVTP